MGRLGHPSGRVGRVTLCRFQNSKAAFADSNRFAFALSLDYFDLRQELRADST